MKRVGIITMYYKNFNYGGLLQAYALHGAVSQYVKNVEQISYNRFENSIPQKTKIFTVLREKGFIAVIKKGIRVFFRRINCVNDKKLKKRNELFQNFMDSIPHSVPVKEEQLVEFNNQYDIFICGSDQIWNPAWWNDAFCLSFVRPGKVKASYAASIGVSELTAEQREYLCSRIRDFDYIAIREKNMMDELETTLGKKVECVLDPTLLLAKEKYELLCTEKIIADKYILVYFLGNNKKNRSLVKKLAKETGLKIVYVPYVGEYGLRDDSYGDYAIYDAGPKQFLTLIRDAELVITDSFHGSVFSILFEKDFYTLRRDKKANKESMNSRVETLLSRFGLENRLVSEFSEITKMLKIDYNKVNQALEAARKDSLDYLKRILKEDEKRVE